MIQKTCELCGKTFYAKLNVARFCSVKCRNIYIGKNRKMTVGKRCINCGKVMYYVKQDTILCRKCYLGGKITKHYYIDPDKPARKNCCWTKKEVEYLTKNYSVMGCDEISKIINKTRKQVLGKAGRLKLRLDKETTQKIVHDAAAKFLRENNPSKKPGASEKLRKRAKERPDIIAKLIEASAKLQKDKPNKLEEKFFTILDILGVKYEHHVLIKPKFIVDTMIGHYIIQIDGDWWHGHPDYKQLNDRQIAQQKRDKAQDKYLASCGYIVIRIWERDVNIDYVRNILRQYNII